MGGKGGGCENGHGHPCTWHVDMGTLLHGLRGLGWPMYISSCAYVQHARRALVYDEASTKIGLNIGFSLLFMINTSACELILYMNAHVP